MVTKTHGIIGVLSIIALVSNLLWLPPLIQTNIGIATGSSSNPIQLDMAALGQTLSVTSYKSGVLKCNFYENVYANYNDGTSGIIGTNWGYPANPLITASIVNPASPTKTITSFSVSLAEVCDNIPNYVTKTTLSGNMKVYAQVSGSDGQQHVLLGGTNIPIPFQTVTNGNLMRFYSYTITPNQIAQYNSLSGTNTFTLKVYVEPTLNYASYFSDPTLPTQNSVYSNWVTQFFTGNVIGGVTTCQAGYTPVPSGLGPSGSSICVPSQQPSSLPSCNQVTPSTNSGCVPSSPSMCPQGSTYLSASNTCTASAITNTVITPPTTTTGTQVAVGSVKFFYSLLFTGDPSQYCGTSMPAPSTGCIVSPTSGPLSIPLSSFNVVGSTRGTINSLQTFNVEPIMTPSVKGLNINPSTGIVYTGALSIDGKTIPLTSSAITSDQRAFVDSDGNFRFPTATINPITIDQVLKQNGVQPTTPDNLVIRIYATGKFSGTGPSGQFQGVLNGPYIDISVWYLSNTASQTTPTPPNTQNNPNCNFGTNQDGTCVPTPSIPPTTNPPPNTPPNQCVNVGVGGVCNDPLPNPITGPSPPPPSGGPVIFPPPNITPSSSSSIPSGICNGSDPTCTNALNNSNGGTQPFQFDSTSITGIVIGIVAVGFIIGIIIYNKNR